MCVGGLDGVRMSVGVSSSICSPASLNDQTRSRFLHVPPTGNLFAVISEKFHLIYNVCMCDREGDRESCNLCESCHITCCHGS